MAVVPHPPPLLLITIATADPLGIPEGSLRDPLGNPEGSLGEPLGIPGDPLGIPSGSLRGSPRDP